MTRGLLVALALTGSLICLAAPTRATPPPPPKFTIVAPPATPQGVVHMRNATWRQFYTAELHALDTFLSAHPQLSRYRDQLWYVGWHNHSQASPHQLAGLMWCVMYTPKACG